MDEKEYEALAYSTLRKVVDLFDEVDIDDADVESSGDVVRIRFGDGSHCVINTQRPTRQIWLAGKGRGWHFDYSMARDCWLDEKGSDRELFDVLAEAARAAGVELPSRAAALSVF